MKPRLLLINPNTTEAITDRLCRLALDEVGDAAGVEAVTARFGARYIASQAAVSVAGFAVLDAYARAVAETGMPDAVVIACFGDPGLDALRETAGVPVIGFADAGLSAAAAAEGSFIIATIGDAWREMLGDSVRRRRLDARLAGFVVLDQNTAQPDRIGQVVDEAAARTGAARVIVGGTGLMPTLESLPGRLSLPFIDPHRQGIRDALASLPAGTVARKSAGEIVGLAGPLTSLLEAR